MCLFNMIVPEILPWQHADWSMHKAVVFLLIVNLLMQAAGQRHWHCIKTVISGLKRSRPVHHVAYGHFRLRIWNWITQDHRQYINTRLTQAVNGIFFWTDSRASSPPPPLTHCSSCARSRRERPVFSEKTYGKCEFIKLF